MNSGFSQSPASQWGTGHHTAALPRIEGGHLVLSQTRRESVTIYDTNTPLGLLPSGVEPFSWYAVRAWAISSIAESASDASNNTQIDFYHGTTADHTTGTLFATLDTQGDPAAGEPVYTLIAPTLIRAAGRILFARITRNGTAVDMAAATFTLGVDLRAYRLA